MGKARADTGVAVQAEVTSEGKVAETGVASLPSLGRSKGILARLKLKLVRIEKPLGVVP